MPGREKEHIVQDVSRERTQEDHQVYQQQTGTSQTIGDVNQHGIIYCTEPLCKCHSQQLYSGNFSKQIFPSSPNTTTQNLSTLFFFCIFALHGASSRRAKVLLYCNQYRNRVEVMHFSRVQEIHPMVGWSPDCNQIWQQPAVLGQAGQAWQMCQKQNNGHRASPVKHYGSGLYPALPMCAYSQACVKCLN